jgi:hypothetical protein
MLFEYTKCIKCNHVNPPYKHICEECKSFLRERVVNLDLWDTILKIIEEPSIAFKQIIFAEHKNFILLLTFLLGLKSLIFSRFLSVPHLGLNGVSTSLMLSLILSIIFSIIPVILLTSAQVKFYKKKGIILRFKDIYSINVYAFIPYIFGLIFIFPVELIVLGGDIFSNNPYSFEIKPLISYMLISMELIVLIWSFILIYKNISLISLSRSFSVTLTSFFFLLWAFTVYLASQIIFIV